MKRELTASRRTFLGSATGLAAAWLAAGCRPDEPIRASATAPDAEAGDAPDTAAAGDVADAAAVAEVADTTAAPDFAALADQLGGALLRPGDAGFSAAAEIFQTRFDAVLPRAIAQCFNSQGVQACVKWAKANKVPVRIRAGGHSYAGFCKDAEALVIDVRGLNQVHLDVQAQTLTVGAGTLLIDAQAPLWAKNLALATGSCPTVGMAGLTLGGGYSLISRQFGLTCDALLSLDIVLASGERLTCDGVQNTDLFWACRGGGGGNFGVVTQLVYAVAPAGQATSFSQSWLWQDAAKVLNAWQQFAPTAPDALTATCHLFAGGDGGAAPTISIGGAFLGTSAALAPLLAQMQALGAPPPQKTDAQTATFGEMAPGWVDCDGVVAHCHLIGTSPDAQVPRGTYFAKSDYGAKLLPDAAIQHLIQSLEARVPSPQAGGVLFDPYGGAVAQIASDATAFVHRDALFVCQYLAFSQPGGPTGADQAWIDAVYQGMRPYVSGQAYQNYVDADLGDWRQAYYAGNLAKLQAIKAKYDPGRFFDFAQAI